LYHHRSLPVKTHTALSLACSPRPSLLMLHISFCSGVIFVVNCVYFRCIPFLVGPCMCYDPMYVLSFPTFAVRSVPVYVCLFRAFELSNFKTDSCVRCVFYSVHVVDGELLRQVDSCIFVCAAKCFPSVHAADFLMNELWIQAVGNSAN